MAERLDDYEIFPYGMREYLVNHGRHFSKPMYMWAVSMMRDRNGNKIPTVEKSILDEKLRANGVAVKNDMGYDLLYIWAMGMADYLGSSVPDEAHLAKFVKDYADDPDGSPTRAFDEFYAKTMALGIPIEWPDMI